MSYVPKHVLFRVPEEQRSGNITMTKEEFGEVLSGDKVKIVVKIGSRIGAYIIEQWMIDCARDMGDYMLFPYSVRSSLVKCKRE